MSARRKVCVVVTARPSYSRVRSALGAISAREDLELQLVIAGSALLDRFGTASSQIESDGFQADENVYMLVEGDQPATMVKTTGLGMIEFATAFDRLQPDVVLTIADRYETMATAIAAAYMNIPLAHLQGGEVTGSIDEKVRHAVTKLSDLHFASTELAGSYICRMGEDPSTVHVTGCPSIDLAAQVAEESGPADDPVANFGGVGPDLDLSEGYLVAMQHPVTTEHELARRHVTETLEGVTKTGCPTLWFWPNPDSGTDGTSKGIRAFREAGRADRIHFFKNIPPLDFLRLIRSSSAIVGNSSVAIREASYLGVPAVNVGTRQEGRERGANVVDVGYSAVEIARAITSVASEPRPACSVLYGDGSAGTQIAGILASADLKVGKRLAYAPSDV